MKFNKNRKKLQGGGYLPGVSGTIQSPTVIEPRNLYSINPFEQVFQKPDLTQYKGLSGTIASKVEAKGLTSDVNQFLSGLSQLQAIESELTDLDILSNSQKFQAYKQIANSFSDPTKQNELRINEDAFNKAQGVVETKKSQSAFTTNGNTVLVYDGRKLDYVSVEQYASSPQSYRVLTNQEALEFRRDNLPGDNSILTAATRTEGIDSIQEHLEKRMANLGSNESKTKYEGLRMVASAINNGQITDINGYEKFSKNNRKAIEALDVTWHYLNEDQKTQLKLMAVRQFGASTPEEIEKGAKLAMSAVFNKGVSTSYSMAMSTDDEFIKGDSSGSSGRAEMGVAELSLAGLYSRGTTTLMSGNNKLQTVSVAANIPVVPPSESVSTTGILGKEKVTIQNVMPFGSTLWGNIARDITTLDGEKVDPKLLIVDKDAKGVLGFEIKVGGVTLDSFSNNPQMKQLDEEISRMDAQAKRTITDPDQLKLALEQNKKTAITKLFGQEAARTYEPVLYFEVTAPELEDSETGVAIRSQRKKNNTVAVPDYETSTYNAVLSASNPQLANQTDTGLFDFSSDIDSFQKLVVKAKPVEGVLNVARAYDQKKVTTTPTVQDAAFRATASGSYRGNPTTTTSTQQGIITGRFPSN